MKQQTAETKKKYEVGSSEWMESQRETLARITGIPNYVDILKSTCLALQGVPKNKQEGK